MADLTINSAEVLHDEAALRESGFVGETVTAGQCVYLDAQADRWFLARSDATSSASRVKGITLNGGATRQSVRIQTEGEVRLGATANVVHGTIYCLSNTPGGIAPCADGKVNHYRTILGVGKTDGVLVLAIHASEVLLASVTDTHLVKAVLAGQVSNNTPQVGAIIDRNGYEEVTFFFNIGTIVDADATFTVLLEGGNDSLLADAAPIADADMVSQLIGTAPEVAASFNFGDDGEVRKLGYLDNTAPVRYLRVTITPALNTGAADFAVICVLSAGAITPVTQPAS